ncbi:MAG: hypothetical protein WEA04_02055 [Candidatus Andersenbacteria bacterium]
MPGDSLPPLMISRPDAVTPAPTVPERVSRTELITHVPILIRTIIDAITAWFVDEEPVPGQVRAVQQDYDGDGVIDSQEWDYNGDGKFDRREDYEAGAIVRVAQDTNGDGIIDEWIRNSVGPVAFKEWRRDTNGDGYADMWGIDTDGDDRPDAWDTNGDGVIDVTR